MYKIDDDGEYDDEDDDLWEDFFAPTVVKSSSTPTVISDLSHSAFLAKATLAAGIKENTIEADVSIRKMAEKDGGIDDEDDKLRPGKCKLLRTAVLISWRRI